MRKAEVFFRLKSELANETHMKNTKLNHQIVRPEVKLRALPTHKSALAIRSKSQYKIVPLSEIVYVQAESCYSHIWDIFGSSWLASKPIKELEHALPNNFIRNHQSFIVNSDFIDIISRNEAVLRVDDVEYRIPISRRNWIKMKTRFTFV